jgi:hypothetical protein
VSAIDHEPSSFHSEVASPYVDVAFVREDAEHSHLEPIEGFDWSRVYKDLDGETEPDDELAVLTWRQARATYSRR